MFTVETDKWFTSGANILTARLKAIPKYVSCLFLNRLTVSTLKQQKKKCFIVENNVTFNTKLNITLHCVIHFVRIVFSLTES